MTILTSKEVKVLNNLGPEAKALGLGSKIQQALKGQLETGSISTSEVAANAISLAKLSLGTMIGVAVEDAKTTSREENVAGLASAIALANSLKTVMNAHAADAAEHYKGGAETPDIVNFPVTEDIATDLASLLTLAEALLTAYDGHDADAEAATPDYHIAQEAGDHSLASAVAPTTLQESLTRLNDLKAKYNAHDADSTAHTTGSTHQEATADVAYGAAIFVVEADVEAGDTVQWTILNSGTGTVTGVTAVAGAGGVTFTFSADPQNDAIISYAIFRTAT